ncbi:MAG: EAL domain-containing protein [Rubrivivax sp.]
MNGTAFIVTRHDPLLVVLSLLIAVFASYVALDLSRRLGASHGRHRRVWWAGGSLAMGTGIWAMHFVGMLGYDAGIPLAFRWDATLASWFAAVVAAAIALGVATHERLTARSLAAGSTSMAAGICTMHYLGMGALDLEPDIVWNPVWIVISVLIAWLASAAALAIFFDLRHRPGRTGRRLQALAALVMGAAIGGMHYSGMAAAQLPQGAICLSTDAMSGTPLALLVGIASLLLLGGTLTLTIFDALADVRESRLTRSLDVAHDALLRRALEDPLTGLPNRVLFEDRLTHALARLAHQASPTRRPDERLAVLFFNLDGFKAINDSFGHEAGDEVLHEAGRRLQACIGEGDTVARLGADEFVALLESRDAEGSAVTLARRAGDSLRTAFVAAGRTVSLSCSVGVALYPEHDDTGLRLLGCANAAMDAAKRAGGDTFVVYERDMAGDAGEQLVLQHALRHALDRGELTLHYQPKVRAAGAQLHGLEALLRWRHPQRGLVSPAIFVPLAERFGLIGAIGHWVLEAACAQLASWQAEGQHCRVAINLSPQQLRQADLPERIAAALARHGLAPDSLVCEVTETAMMENLGSERGVLDAIAALGVCVSIDDFGTGYSSLAHLRSLPARQLKIDRSFVADLGQDPAASAVLDAIVRLAHAVGMEVVAEGVETAAQQAALTELGCDLLQGYVIARPMPAEAVLAWIAAFEGTAEAS